MPGVDARFWLLPFSLALIIIIIISSLRIPRWVFFLLFSSYFSSSLPPNPFGPPPLVRRVTAGADETLYTHTHQRITLKHAQSNRLWSLLLRRRFRHPPRARDYRNAAEATTYDDFACAGDDQTIINAPSTPRRLIFRTRDRRSPLPARRRRRHIVKIFVFIIVSN